MIQEEYGKIQTNIEDIFLQYGKFKNIKGGHFILPKDRHARHYIDRDPPFNKISVKLVIS